MDNQSIKKHISAVGIALSFVLLSACNSGSEAEIIDPATTTRTAAEISAAQALIDAAASISPFDYAATAAARTSCLDGDAVIDTVAEITCYQSFLETIIPVS